MKRKVSIVLVIAMLALALASCSGGAAAGGKTQGIYLSPASMTYSNFRPGYNYYTLSFTQEELTLLDNSTYCLVISASTFSGIELSESTSDASGNERANSVTKLYGTYTSKPNDLDEDMLDVTLSSPSRITKSNDQQYWLDTDAWTEAMGKIVIPPAGRDENGNAIIDENAAPWTAQQYLESLAFGEKTIQVNGKTASFDFDAELIVA